MFSTKSKTQNVDAFCEFFKNREHLAKKVQKSIRKLEKSLKQSSWFWNHEIICSSLMICIYEDTATVHMIDFGKTIHHPNSRISHDVPWVQEIAQNKLIELN